jgi:hypothetical protein
MNEEKAKELSKKFTDLTNGTCNTAFMKRGKFHKPTTLPSDKKGVYVFLLSNKICFKVGKAGSASQARWNSHHYSLDKSTPSTFTKSFLSDLDDFKNHFNDEQKKEIESFKAKLLEYEIKNLKEDIKKLSKDTVRKLSQELKLNDWIKNNIDRIEFLIPASDNDYDLNLLEALIQFELKPIYEGKRA